MTPKTYTCKFTNSLIQIDGKPFGGAWESAEWSEEFVDISGDPKLEPKYKTRFKMLWDDEALYFGADLIEPHLWATLTEHDSIIFQDNDFEVFIDPDGDSKLYAELEINALNTTWDLLLVETYRNGGPAIHGWEIIGLETAVNLRGTLNDPTNIDDGWSVTIKWPFIGLKELTKVPCPPQVGDQWRINFSRVQWPHEVNNGKYCKPSGSIEDNWVWSPQGEIDMHLPDRWGFLDFVK